MTTSTVLHDITSDALLAAGYRLLFAGDDYDYTITVHENDVPVDLTNATIWFTIKKCYNDPDEQARLTYVTSSDITISSPATNGTFVVHFSGEDTANLAGTWFYGCKAVLGSGRTKHLAHGRIEFLPAVVHTAGPGEDPTETVGETHIYVDADTGDDENSGASWTRALATIEAALERIPSVLTYSVMVHLRGVFTYAEWAELEIKGLTKPADQDDWVKLVIRGDEDPTVLDGPRISDINSASTIGLTTAGWTPDEHKGYFIEILTGPTAGERRRVFSNTDSTLVPHKDFTADPGSGAQFRVVRPTTEISGAVTVGCSLKGTCVLQDLYFSNAAGFWAQDADYLIVTNTFITTGTWGGRQSTVAISDLAVDDDFAWDFSVYGGGFTAQGSTEWTGHFGDCEVSILAAQLGYFLQTGGGAVGTNTLSAGTRITGPVLLNAVVPMDSPTSSRFFGGTYSNYRQSLVENAAGVGLTVKNSAIDISGRGVEIRNCGSHGVELIHSRIAMRDGNLIGSGNAGAGVYAHSHSEFVTKDGSPPTVTGTVGNLAVSDPTVEEATWAELESGVKVAILTEMTLARKA